MSTINSVPLLDLKAQYRSIKEEIEPVVSEVMASQYFIGGPKLQAFESHIADYTSAKFALGVSSGTDALLLALMALDIKPGDEVIVPVYSFFATAGCVSRMGAVPVFVDIEAESYNIDIAKIEQVITDKTKAIIPVHLYGQMADIKALKRIAQKHNIAIIEDAAQAIGAADDSNNQAGTVGDIGCFSFFPSKNLGAFGDGGLVTTNDETLYNKMNWLKNHGANPKYYHKFIGGNFRLDALQAAVLDIKLKYLEGWTKGRQKNAAYYREQIQSRGLDKYIGVPYQKTGYKHIYNQFILRTEKRDALLKHLQNNNIGCEIYYPLTFNNQACFAYLNYSEGDFPVAEKAAKETLAIPIYPELTNEQKNYIIDTIDAFF